MKITKLTNRIMFLSPTVQAGWENESYRSDFQNICVLGQGSYGIVWKAKHKKTGAIYAIKEIKKKSISSEKMMANVRNEVKIMYCLNHPNIVKLYNHFEDQFAIYFVLQYAEKGELYKAMLKANHKRFSEIVAAKYVSQIAKALAYIHSLNIIHRDIKPENILINKDDELKLADFGWSNFNHGQNKRQTYCGTLDYLAPQMVDQSHLHDYRVDVWSLGVLIYELTTGSSPFSYQLLQNNTLSQSNIKSNIINLNYHFTSDLTKPCKDIITKILVIKPEARLSIADILDHPWLKQVQKKLDNEDGVKEGWRQKLKTDFGWILQERQQQAIKYEAFSKEEIYSCSRVESVINVKERQKIGESNDKKMREYQLRIKELQIGNRRQEQELKYLRNVKLEHQQTLVELAYLRQQHRTHNKQIDIMALRLRDKQTPKG